MGWHSLPIKRFLIVALNDVKAVDRAAAIEGLKVSNNVVVVAAIAQLPVTPAKPASGKYL